MTSLGICTHKWKLSPTHTSWGLFFCIITRVPLTVEGTTIQVVEKPQEKIGIDMTSGHIHTYISMTTVLELVGAKLLT